MNNSRSFVVYSVWKRYLRQNKTQKHTSDNSNNQQLGTREEVVSTGSNGKQIDVEHESSLTRMALAGRMENIT